MNFSTSDILLASSNREIVLWRRMGGTNPGYGLDVDGTTVQFAGKGLPKLRAVAQALAKARGLTLEKPIVIRVPVAGSAGTTHTDPEVDRMLGRFYYDDTEYAWGEPMRPEGTKPTT